MADPLHRKHLENRDELAFSTCFSRRDGKLWPQRPGFWSSRTANTLSWLSLHLRQENVCPKILPRKFCVVSSLWALNKHTEKEVLYFKGPQDPVKKKFYVLILCITQTLKKFRHVFCCSQSLFAMVMPAISCNFCSQVDWRMLVAHKQSCVLLYWLKQKQVRLL